MKASKFNKLIERIKQFDEKAFEEIYNEYGRLILWIALKITKNPVDAQDVHSIVMNEIWNNAIFYEYIEKPDDWISLLAKNRAINFYNKHIKRQLSDVEHEFVSEFETVEFLSVENNFSEIEFDAIISCLREKEQRIVKLKIFYKYTHKEIAEELNLPLGTVTWSFNNALKKLQIKLSEKNII